MRNTLFLLLCTTSLSATNPIPPIKPANITLTATGAWHLYHSRMATDAIQQARLCKLEVKNRSGHPILIRQLRLRWEATTEKGQAPAKLHAGIYKYKHDAPVIPDEEHFIAPGTWNPDERVLTFSFSAAEPLKVTAVHNYYIVVKFDQNDRSILAHSTVAYDPSLPLITEQQSCVS